MKHLLNLLLLFIPVAAGLAYSHGAAGWVFLASNLAIVPLAKHMGTATEAIAVKVGPAVGGLLNATFGNATELIIAMFALHAGLYEVVQASLTGSIIGNILFVLGAAMLLGGLKHPTQYFNRTVAGTNASLMVVAVVGLLVPAGFGATVATMTPSLMQKFSIFVAAILIVVYVCNLVFALKTHVDLYVGGEGQHEEEEEPPYGLNVALGVLLVTTLLVAWMSELLVGSIEHVTHDLGLSERFIGVILLPIVGNAAEHMTAVTVAMKNKMDLSLGVAIGSATQIALLVAPVLVLAGAVMGKPLTLAFNPFEVLTVVMAVLIANFITLDGESNWLEGIMLLATYGILAVAFLLHP